MFNKAISFNQPLDKWNVDKLTDCFEMFIRCKSFSQNLENWKLDQYAITNNMFLESKLEILNKLPSWYVLSK